MEPLPSTRACSCMTYQLRSCITYQLCSGTTYELQRPCLARTRCEQYLPATWHGDRVLAYRRRVAACCARVRGACRGDAPPLCLLVCWCVYKGVYRRVCWCVYKGVYQRVLTPRQKTILTPVLMFTSHLMYVCVFERGTVYLFLLSRSLAFAFFLLVLSISMRICA